MTALRALTPIAWLTIAMLVLALIVLATCQARNAARGDASRSEAAQTLAEGRTAASGDASAIRDRADERDHQTTTTVQEATDEIRNAPDRAAADRIARERVCRLTDYRDPRCAVFRPDPRTLE